VAANFIIYPNLKSGQFLSTRAIGFGELLTSANAFQFKSPILKNHELVMTDDLTDNDLILRQINYSHIISRLIKRRLSDSSFSDDFKFYELYGDAKYWRRANVVMRLILLVFLILCLSQKLFIKALLFLSAPIPLVQKLNIFI
jgi:hypothetical protein